MLYGTGFRHHCPRGDGTAFEIVGEPRGGAAFLSIRPASEEARALRDDRGRAGARRRASCASCATCSTARRCWPGATGRTARSPGRTPPTATASTPPAGDLPDHRIADAFGHVLEEVPLTARGADSRRRVAVPGRDDGEPHWFELSRDPGAGGETFGFALDADDLVAAEASLRRFVETLTETFAHLPIGLAVFDKNRRLGLFNPALTDLVKIDAVWLAGRPSLRDFLERLRETRQMPEQKDFASWRRKLGELEEGARDGHLRGELAAALGQDLPRHRPAAPAGRARLPVRGHLDGDHARAQVPLRARAQPGDARPDVRGGRGLRRLGHAGLRQLRLRGALGPRPDGAARRPRRRRDDRALGRALRPEPGLGAARRVRHRRRGAHQLDRRRSRPATAARLADAGRAAARRLGAGRLPRPRRRRRGAGAGGAAPRRWPLEQLRVPVEALLPQARRRRSRPRRRPRPSRRSAAAPQAPAGRAGARRASCARWRGGDAADRRRPLAARSPRALAARGLALDAPADAAAWTPGAAPRGARARPRRRRRSPRRRRRIALALDGDGGRPAPDRPRRRRARRPRPKASASRSPAASSRRPAASLRDRRGGRRRSSPTCPTLPRRRRALRSEPRCAA